MTPDPASSERLRHCDRERPTDVDDGDEASEHYENLRRQVSQAEKEDRETHEGDNEHERVRMVVARRAGRWMVRVVFRAAPGQDEEEGDGAQAKGRQRDAKP